MSNKKTSYFIFPIGLDCSFQTDYFGKRDRAVRLAHRAHNPKVVGSNPAPASILKRDHFHYENGPFSRFFCRDSYRAIQSAKSNA